MLKLVKLDRFGKIFIPKRYRNKLQGTTFTMEFIGDDILLHPVKDPLELFGTLDGITRKDIEEVHDDDDHEDLA